MCVWLDVVGSWQFGLTLSRHSLPVPICRLHSLKYTPHFQEIFFALLPPPPPPSYPVVIPFINLLASVITCLIVLMVCNCESILKINLRLRLVTIQ